MRGRMDLASYDRLFPSQDVVQVGGLGNLIAAPLQGRARRRGATVFLDLATMEPHEDQWAYLSSLGRLTPEGSQPARAAARPRRPRRGGEPAALPHLHEDRRPAARRRPGRLGATITVEAAELPPALLATLKHAASMPNPGLLRAPAAPSLHLGHAAVSAQLRRDTHRRPAPAAGLQDRLTTLVEQAGSRLELADERDRAANTPIPVHRGPRPRAAAAHDALAGHDLGVLVAPPGRRQDGHRLRADRHHAVPHWCWSTAKPSPTSGGPASASCWASRPGSAAADAAARVRTLEGSRAQGS